MAGGKNKSILQVGAAPLLREFDRPNAYRIQSSPKLHERQKHFKSSGWSCASLRVFDKNAAFRPKRNDRNSAPSVFTHIT
jgi:hypothetical protein